MKDFSTNLKPADPSGPSILTHERLRSNINTTELTHHLLHRKDFLSRQTRILKILESNPLFQKHNQLNLSRPDRYHLGLARAKALRRLSLEHNWSQDDYMMADYLVDDLSPYYLQATMFATSIREQSNDEQKAYWLPKVENWDIIGCYGQTELGHGSNVKGIETRATWDPDTKEFTIHSPTLTASKWWNGSLGRTANHAIVVAQLLLPTNTSDKNKKEYKSHGPHQFILQIRDMKTHLPLPGIIIGDIGPKYGYTSMDNGYMLFDQHRVPHSALLSRYSGVDSDTGTYMSPEKPATVYGSLTFVRAQIVERARLVLARAVTIAIRYTSIRRQFADRDSSANAPEEAVLNYPTVQIRLLPLLATTFALHYTGEAMFNLYRRTRKQIEKSGDFSRLAEMHAQSSGLKSLCTMLAADGIEVCRRAMGGHGFGGGSGIIPLNNDYLSKPTVEGDNWMITQQTSRYLIKRMAQVIQNPNSKSEDSVDALYRTFLTNLHEKKVEELDIFGSDQDTRLLRAFQRRAAYLAHEMYTARIVQKRNWTSLMIPLHRLSQAHSEMLLVSNFHAAITSSPLSEQTISILRLCFRLFALNTLSSSPAEFITSNAITVAQLPRLAPTIQGLMEQIRPHCVRLVDAWAVPDYLLQSALGRSNGDVYVDLFRKAHMENPLNRVTFNPDWRSEEIVMGEGEESARRRVLELVRGVVGGNDGDEVKAKL